MNNLEIRKFQQTIINFANQSNLPIEVKRLCFAEIMMQLNAEAERQVYAEKAEEDNQKKKQENIKAHTEAQVSCKQ